MLHDDAAITPPADNEAAVDWVQERRDDLLDPLFQLAQTLSHALVDVEMALDEVDRTATAMVDAAADVEEREEALGNATEEWESATPRSAARREAAEARDEAQADLDEAQTALEGAEGERDAARDALEQAIQQAREAFAELGVPAPGPHASVSDARAS